MPLSLKALGHLKSVLKAYLLGMLFFSFFRLLLVATNWHLIEEINDDRWKLLGKALVMGFRFDTVISCYILGLPVVLIGLVFLAGSVRKWLLDILYCYIGVFFIVSFFVCSVDVPFFNYFFSRLNDTIFNWSGSSFGFKMVVQEPRFYVFFFVFAIISACYVYFLKKIWRKHRLVADERFTPLPGKQLVRFVPVVLLIWGMTFLGIRGRTAEKTPILAGTAFFSNNPFINQLGLNPVFSLMRSTLDDLQPENKHFHKLADNDALQTTASILHADPGLKGVSPIARWERSDAPLKGRNVVLVIMESMSAAKMGRFGNQDGMTPFLDSLASQCWSFDNIYSAGIHTYNGIYTSLFAHPAIMHRHTMDHVNVPKMAGFSNTLRKANYQTVFFTTHDELFDNMSGFLSANDFQHIIGQKDYPASEVKSTLGVPDEFMFRFSINELNKLSGQGHPFFAAYMTGSDHDPIVVPAETGFKRRHTDDEKAVVAYADWSLKRFMEYASKQSWYNNSVFVFVADHGDLIGKNAYDIAFSYHHIPFLIFAPGFTKPQPFSALGLQSDVFPTVAGLLLPSLVNNTFGINLLQEKRPCIVFSADDKLACMNDSLLYVYRENAPASLYKYKKSDLFDYSRQLNNVSSEMKHMAFSWLQTSEWLLSHDRASVK